MKYDDLLKKADYISLYFHRDINTNGESRCNTLYNYYECCEYDDYYIKLIENLIGCDVIVIIQDNVTNKYYKIEKDGTLTRQYGRENFEKHIQYVNSLLSNKNVEIYNFMRNV